MRQCPLLHEPGGIGGKMAVDDFAGFDRDVGLLPAINRKEMWRRMVDEIHPDSDAVEVSDGRHEPCPRRARAFDLRIHHFSKDGLPRQAR